MPKVQRDEFDGDPPMVVPVIGSKTAVMPPPPVRPPPAAAAPSAAAMPPPPVRPPPAAVAPPAAAPPRPATPAPPPAPPAAPPIGTIGTASIPMPMPLVGSSAFTPPPQTQPRPPAVATFDRREPAASVNPDVGLNISQTPPDAREAKQREAREAITGQQIEDLTPDSAEARQDFARPTSSNAPSNFVSFSDFAGLNDDMVRDIADRAAAQSEKKRQGAASLLAAAKAESTASVPLEKTASYAKYLEAVKSAGADALSATGRTENPYEEALRGVYSGAQSARENRLQTNALKRGANSAKLSKEEYAAAAAAAEAEAKRAAEAAAAKKIADAKQATKEADEERRDAIKARNTTSRRLDRNPYGD